MAYKRIRVCFVLLTLILTAAFAAGCASGAAPRGAVPDSPSNSFDYGITFNVPADWDSNYYTITSEENPEYRFMPDYPILYGVHYDYTSGSETYGLVSLYVLNAVDWNELSLGHGEGPGFGIQAKKDDKFAYVVTGWPSEAAFYGTDDNDRFNAMAEDVHNGLSDNFAGLFTIGATDKKPDITESRNKTVKCELGYFSLNIPTTWDADDLSVDYEYSDIQLEGYEAVYMIRYALKTGSDTSENLFTAYLFDNGVWARLETDYEGAPPPAYKIAANGEYTLAVVLPQDNPLDRDSDLGKKFDRMIESVYDFDSFFEFY